MEGTTIADRKEMISDYLSKVSGIIANIPIEVIEELVQTLNDAYKEGRQVLLCGNGGSGALASHLACDLQKGVGGFSEKKFRVMALTDAMPLVTAWANDTDYSRIFAEQVRTWGRAGDVLIAISGSGNSPNVIKAVEAANELGMKTIGITGMGGGKLAQIAKMSYIVPSDNMQQIEDVHTVLGHLVFTCVWKENSAGGSCC
jgi:D-sedoheptulose 7-phosphate isomerase